jgi:hypothetical protein
MCTSGDELEQMALASAVRSHHAYKARIVVKPKLDILKVSPLRDLDGPYPQGRLLMIKVGSGQRERCQCGLRSGRTKKEARRVWSPGRKAWEEEGKSLRGGGP